MNKRSTAHDEEYYQKLKAVVEDSNKEYRPNELYVKTARNVHGAFAYQHIELKSNKDESE